MEDGKNKTTHLEIYQEREEMEHSKHNQVGFGLSIIELIENQILDIAKEEFKNDTDSPPNYIVSLNNEDMDNQSIMITIVHQGIKFTEKLFPRKSTEYGFYRTQ